MYYIVKKNKVEKHTHAHTHTSQTIRRLVGILQMIDLGDFAFQPKPAVILIVMPLVK